MWLLIIIGIAVVLFIALFIYDYKLNTNEVKICVYETEYSIKGDLYYHAKYKKKGGIFWLDFVEFCSLYSDVRPIVKRSPSGFYFLKDYNYKQCLDFNDRAYSLEEKAKKERKANKYKTIS